VERGEAAALSRVRVGAGLEEQVDELVLFALAAAALCSGVTSPNVGETAWTSAPRSRRSAAVSG
jgi:hypothetical protein